MQWNSSRDVLGVLQQVTHEQAANTGPSLDPSYPSEALTVLPQNKKLKLLQHANLLTLHSDTNWNSDSDYCSPIQYTSPGACTVTVNQPSLVAVYINLSMKLAVN